jgi:hypothetical protein
MLILVPPEGVVDDVTMGLWQSRRALWALARRKAWEPSIEDCRAIAEPNNLILAIWISSNAAREHG